jgi:hypothetical protein
MERVSEIDQPCEQPSEVERQDTVSNSEEGARKAVDDEIDASGSVDKDSQSNKEKEENVTYQDTFVNVKLLQDMFRNMVETMSKK